MRQTWMRKILLFSVTLAVLASCTKPEYSSDEPFEAELQTNMYVVSEGNMLYALNPMTGDVRWKFYDINGISYEPLALNSYVFVNTPAAVLKLNALDGNVVDTVIYADNGNGKTPLGPLNGQGDFIYVPYKQTVNGQDVSNVVKYNYQTREETGWAVPIGGNVLPTSPIIFGKQILIPFALGATLRSVEDAAVNPWLNTGDVISTPNNPTTDGISVFATSGNSLVAYSFDNGAELWRYDAPATINTSPILYGGNILFGCNDNKVYCIDSIAHQPRWTFLTDERVFCSPYAYEQTIYFGSNDHYFYAVNVDDGTLKWKYRTGALVKSSPIAYEGMVYVGSFDQNMYAFDTTGALRWKYQVNGLIDKSPAIYDPMNNNKQVYPAVSGLSSQ